jgi:hypothetical protein
MHGVVVMKVLSKQLIVQTFVEHKHYPFIECVEKLLFFLLYIFQAWCVILA